MVEFVGLVTCWEDAFAFLNSPPKHIFALGKEGDYEKR